MSNQILLTEFNSPLRYPGGKNKLTKYIATTFLINGFSGKRYVEPYAGGASIAINLLKNHIAKEIVINDIDSNVYLFWKTVVAETDKLCNAVNEVDVSMKTWDQSKEIMANPSRYTDFERGFATFFLNRTNRSGILSAGVIGGKLQAGHYTLGARFNKPNLAWRIATIGAMKSQIVVSNKDAYDLMNDEQYNNDFWYIDPPYYNKGSKLYKNSYIHDDHLKISNFLTSGALKYFILTYDSTAEIKELYSSLNSEEFGISYHASQQIRRGLEVIIFSDNILLPESDNPLDTSLIHLQLKKTLIDNGI